MGPKHLEDQEIVIGIRRVEEDDIPGIKAPVPRERSSQIGMSFGLDNLTLIFFNTAKIEIGLDQRAHLSRLIDKDRVSCTPRQGLNSDCSRPGAKIKKARIFDSWRDDVEECLAETIRSRPHLK